MPEERKPILSTQDGLDLYNRNRLAPVFFGLLFLAATIALATTLLPFVHDIVLAMVVVALLRPTYMKIRTGIGNRWLASGVVTTLVVVLVAAPLSFLVVSFVQQARAAYRALQSSLSAGELEVGPLGWVVEWVRNALSQAGVSIAPAQVSAMLAEAAEWAEDAAFAAGGDALSHLAAAVIHAAVMLMVVFYLMVDADRLAEFVFKLSPLPREEEELIVRRFGEVARGTLLGNGIGSIAQGALCGIAVWAAGLPSALFWGTVMSIFAFLPMVGVFVVVLPMTVYLFFTASLMKTILFATYCAVVALVFENVVKTKLIGAGAAMPDLLAFLAILGGLAVFGVLGLLYGPLIATAFLTFNELYMTHYRRALALSYAGRTA